MSDRLRIGPPGGTTSGNFGVPAGEFQNPSPAFRPVTIRVPSGEYRKNSSPFSMWATTCCLPVATSRTTMSLSWPIWKSKKAVVLAPADIAPGPLRTIGGPTRLPVPRS